MSEPRTFEAEAARIDLVGQPLLNRLTATSDAGRLALLGDWSALFRLLAGEAQLTAGRLEMLGIALPLCVQLGKVGVMRLDTLLPPSFSGEQLLASSAELAGLSRKAAAGAAFAVLERLGLAELSSKRLGHLHAAERRALLIGHALLTDPRLLCLEQPLAGLDTSAEQLVLAVIERALPNRRLIVSLSESAPSPGERELLARCDDRLRLAGGIVVSEVEQRANISRFTATVCRNHQAFAQALMTRGLRAHPTHEAGLLGALTSPQAGPAWRYLVELDDGSTGGILDAAIETDAGLIELVQA